MATNYLSDQDIERALKQHFAAEANELRAPVNLWESLEGRLEDPDVPRGWRKLIDAIGRIRTPLLTVSASGAAVVAILAILLTSRGGGEQIAEVMQEVPVEKAVPQMAQAPVEKVVEAPVEKVVIQEVEVEKVATPARRAEEPAMKQRTVEVEVERVVEKVVEKVVTKTVEAMARAEPTPAPAATAAARPADTRFRDQPRQPQVATSEDAVSTFSLDIDRTSYQLALAWARQGHDIEPDSVRAEEWVNAFDYQYDPPSDRWGFAISTDVLAHPLDNRKNLARIGFQAARVVDDRPLNVTLVLDASGSMEEGNRVAIARAAAEAVRQSLRPGDRIAVVQFTQDVVHDLTVTHREPDAPAVRSSIEQLRPRESTNVQAGLNLGVRLANEARLERPDAYNYFILMSDGVANVDATNPFAILESAYDRDASNPLRLITIGVGISNYNDVLLEQLAQHGNGWYRYLDSTDQARATFSRDNWLVLSTPFADQTRAQVTWDPEAVKYWRIIGYENRVTSDESFAQDRKEFAEIHSGAATTVFYELELHEGVLETGDFKLGKVELRWVVPDTGQSRGQQAEVIGRIGADQALRPIWFDADPLLQFGAIVALAADRYSVLPDGYEGEDVDALADLSKLADLLGTLRSRLGGLDAYRDFSFLLGRMVETASAQAPPATPSGYSP
ncbi:MAG: von Willebrand factor type A domain-containing protein [Chloroflexi bacterium]|nr:von Willebrand factor type A domain-containing protein [Chloroflexota bacterium]MCY3937934.1 von Willebrand factor type A domain-containing protein [Chloroflexota bacterium]